MVPFDLHSACYKIIYRYFLHMITFLLVLFVQDIQCQSSMNRAPQFIPGQDMSRFSLSENTPVNSPVYQLRGIDPEGGKLRYSISGPVFSVDRDTGVVRLRQELDREVQDLVEVIISITDETTDDTEPNTVSLRREIPIRDFNDNPPIFLGRPYSAKLSEITPVGSVVRITPPIEVIDRDEGINSDITFSCYFDKFKENDKTCDFFKVTTEKISEGRFNATITLAKQLDFETRPSYILTLLATDAATTNPLSAFATVLINVIDIQDQPPIFINAPYSITIKENTPAETSVLTIKSKDGDSGSPRPVQITIEDDVGGHFRLEPINISDSYQAVKLITTDIPLDREANNVLQNGGVYTFQIRATEIINGFPSSDSTVTQVSVVLIDVDDNLPTFNQEVYNVSVPENLENDTPLPGLSIYVTDLDVSENSKYELSLVDVRNADNVFAVTPKYGEGRTPVVVRVVDSKRLDFDVEDVSLREFIFDIVATNKDQKHSKARVIVNLQDMNDNVPTFEKSSYGLKMAENTEIGTKISDIRATDIDSDKYGQVKYVMRGFGAENFYTEKDTGGVFVRKNLDFEVQKNYILTMVAIDGGGRETNANLYIEILDTNDNVPVWEQKEYVRTIREGALEFEPQFFVRATDIDGLDQGAGKIMYSIASENSISGHVFTIDSDSGEIKITKPVSSMDTERGEYELKITAVDAGDPPLNSSTMVHIRVGISGNQRPIFKGHLDAQKDTTIPGPPSYRVNIPENAEPGYNVTTVRATDPDGIDSLLVYKIVGGNDNFAIDENSGRIIVTRDSTLDRDISPDSYTIVVNAIDAGYPIPETATATVYVKVQDINDKPPKFIKSSYTAYVSEIAKNNTEIITVQARDTDLDAQIVYSIVEPIKANSKSGIQLPETFTYDYRSAFRIDSQSGKIYVNNTLNYNQVSSIILSIEARDLKAVINKENQFDRTEVTLFIQPYKNTNPIFTNLGWSTSYPYINFDVDEETSTGTTILRLEAEDPVSQSVITSFELIQPDSEGYVTVNERTGDIALKKRLDYEHLSNQTTFTFIVRAIVSSGKRSSVANVNMTVRNINDHSPIFDKTSYKITILESVKYPETILTIHATDNDAVLSERDLQLGFNQVRYSLAGANAPLFTIDNQTGVIKVAKGQYLDREKMSMIKLTGVAEDAFGKVGVAARTTISILIELLDVNDNAPSFRQQVFTSVIPENAAIDSFVIKIDATDPDEGPGGEVSYEFLNEGEANGLLKINPVNGEVRTIKSLNGKGRSEPYEIVVRAQDNGEQVPKHISKHNDAIFLLYVGDISANDGIPYFIAPKLGQAASVSENSTIGTTVFQVIASDPDSPSISSGKIRYRIQSESEDAKSFRIDSLTGLITTVKELDREVKDTYNVIIEVSDMGEPPQAVTRVLKINVVDVDDNMPRFVREIDASPIELTVLEEQPPGTVVGVIAAIDEDIEENGAIDYVIIDGNEQEYFTINKTEDNKAIISTSKILDREEQETFILTIKCLKQNKFKRFDIRKPYNPQDLSESKLLIKVVDIDDHLPQFLLRNESIGIRHNIPINTLVATIKAIDLDSSAKKINISIEKVNFVSQFHRRGNESFINLNKIFFLNNETGEVRNRESLSDYVDGYFELKLKANNSDNPKRFAEITLKLFVIRDKSLLRFIFTRPPTEINTILPEFTSHVQAQLKSKMDLELSVFDAQVLQRPDHSLEFSSTASCFQLSKYGNALSPHEMKKIMDSEEVREALLETYVTYSVAEVESCVGSKLQTAGIGGTSGTWLVILAAMIGIGSLVALISTCCLFKRREPRYNTQILAPRIMHSDVYASQPVLIDSTEPVYGPL